MKSNIFWTWLGEGREGKLMLHNFLVFFDEKTFPEFSEMENLWWTDAKFMNASFSYSEKPSLVTWRNLKLKEISPIRAINLILELVECYHDF